MNSGQQETAPPLPTVGRPGNTPRLPGALALDLRSLALFRIGLGLLLLWDVLQRWLHWSVHYSEVGVLPRGTLMRAVWRDTWFSLATVVSKPGEQHVFFFLLAAVAASLIIGWHTRWATFLAWVGLISLHNRNPLILDLGDAYLRLTMFWMLFLPWGSVWSLDARQGRSDNSIVTDRPARDGPTVRSIASLALLLQMLLIVGSIASAASLTVDPSNPRGMPWAQVFQDPPFSLLPFAKIEILGLLLLCWPFDRGQIGGVSAVLLALLNGSLAVATGSGLLFPLLALLPTALLRSWWWDVRLARLAAAIDKLTAPAAPSGPETAGSGQLAWSPPRMALHGLVILLVFGWTFVHANGWMVEAKLPRGLVSLGQFLRLDPPSERFPLTFGSYSEPMVMNATRRDGTKLTLDRSREWSLDVRSHRERNHLATLWSGQDPWLLWAYGHYLCRRWSPETRGLSDLDQLKVSARGHLESGSSEELVLLDHKCFTQRR